MKCKQCNNELSGKQRQFCSDKCRMTFNRLKANKSEQNPVQSEQIREQMQSEQLKRTGPSIPGDPDYIGVCTKVDGRWAVTGKHRPIEQPKDLDYSTLPDGVVKPWSEQRWSCTPEYQQTVNNLMTMTAEQLESIGQFVPVWKAA